VKKGAWHQLRALQMSSSSGLAVTNAVTSPGAKLSHWQG
jgi:hypothetical protein